MVPALSFFAAAIVVFATTNIDDIVLLATFFGDPRIRRRAVVVGQFLGIGTLTAASAGAGYLALAVPQGWPALLGVVPLALGLHKLIELRRPIHGEARGTESLLASEKKAETRLHSQVLAVSAVTLANGGDNLGVYIPLFARDPSVIPDYVATFAAMTGIWCFLGYALVKNPAGAVVMRRWGHVLLPIVLIAIGGHILWGAQVLLG
jgi:cadmium resistance protein CadD (predicted permease)